MLKPATRALLNASRAKRIHYPKKLAMTLSKESLSRMKRERKVIAKAYKKQRVKGENSEARSLARAGGWDYGHARAYLKA